MPRKRATAGCSDTVTTDAGRREVAETAPAFVRRFT
jgi:hypothetical protein